MLIVAPTVGERYVYPVCGELLPLRLTAAVDVLLRCGKYRVPAVLPCAPLFALPGLVVLGCEPLLLIVGQYYTLSMNLKTAIAGTLRMPQA